jgi:tetratricopeptide (TPR) repeat protein
MAGSSPRHVSIPTHLPLIGRDEELARVLDAARAVREHQSARAVTLVGPNGAGKSRLIDEVVSELNEGTGRRFRVLRAGSRGTTSGHDVLTSLLRARFGLVEGASVAAVREQVRSQVAKVLDDRKVGDVCFFLGQLLSVPFPDSPMTKAVADDPAEGEVLCRVVLRRFFEADAARGPLCLVFDDLDGAGDDTLRLLSYLVEHLSGSVLILAAARPEFVVRSHPWFIHGGDRHVRVDLGPVHDVIAERVMAGLLAPCKGGAPTELIDAGVRLARGNVGLLMAMVRIFHDAGVLVDASDDPEKPAWRVNLSALAQARLPYTVEEAIDARVDALTVTERQLLTDAAVMGMTFWRGGLIVLGRSRQVAPAFWKDTDSEEDLIDATLRGLEARDYVIQRDSTAIADQVEFAFRHGRERERLLNLVEPGDRRERHRVVADWLSGMDAMRSHREYAAILARHLAAAGDDVRAGHHYLDAGDAAREGRAAKEADDHYRRGLELLGTADIQRRVRALHDHGDVLVLLGRTDDAFAAFYEMLTSAYRLDLRGRGGAAHNRIGRLHRSLGNLTEATQHFETALLLFESVGDQRGVSACYDDVGKVLWLRGDYDAALSGMKRALEMRKALGDRRSIALSLHNIGAVFRDFGRPTQAQEAFEAALGTRREIGDLVGVAQTLNGLGKLAQDQRKLEEARTLYQEAYDVAREVGEKNRMAIVLTNLGEIHYRLGESEEAIRILTRAEGLCDELGDKLYLAEAKRGLAKAYLLQGDLKRARAAVKPAVDLFGAIRSKPHLAAALRTLGEITAAGAWGAAHEGKAVDYFLRSIALCKEIGNELEIAKSYHSFATYVQHSNHYKDNGKIQREAEKLGAMSAEIFSRLRITPEEAPS